MTVALDDFWRDLAASVYVPAGSTPSEMTDRRRAFYAGAASMLKVFELASQHENSEEFMAHLTRAYAEIERFQSGLFDV